jgi:hypothetical protein
MMLQRFPMEPNNVQSDRHAEYRDDSDPVLGRADGQVPFTMLVLLTEAVLRRSIRHAPAA